MNELARTRTENYITEETEIHMRKQIRDFNNGENTGYRIYLFVCLSLNLYVSVCGSHAMCTLFDC